MEGPKLLRCALGSELVVSDVFVAAGARERAGIAEILERSAAAGAHVLDLRPGVIERISDTVTPQQVLAIVRRPHQGEMPLGEILTGAPSVLVAAGVKDPGNLGALVRAADASGAGAVFVCDGSVDPFNPKVVRSSAGSVINVPVVSGGDSVEALRLLGASGFARLGAVVRGGTAYSDLDLAGKVAFVFGNESTGLSRETAAALDGSVTIPMRGKAESLNVAMAAAVLCFEALRQRSTLRGTPRTGPGHVSRSRSAVAPGPATRTQETSK